MSRAARTPRISGLRVAHETFWHGLSTDSALVRGVEGSDIACFQFNRRLGFVLSHPDYVDHVLYGGVEKYRKSVEYELLRSVVGTSLFTDEGESWRRHRMMLNPVLAKRHLATMFDLMLEPIEAAAHRLTDGGAARHEIEMRNEMTELTLEVVGSALFGRGMSDFARRIGRSVTSGLRAAERATRVLVIANPPNWLARGFAEFVHHAPLLPPPLSSVQAVMKTIDTTTWDVIRDRQAHPRNPDDLLGLLLSVRDEHGQPLPTRRVRDEVATFLLAGHETTANALTWMWYLLAINQEPRQRMLAEIDEVLGDRAPTFADVAQLRWTTACFLEAMRMFSPAWAIPRICVEDDEIDSHRIRRGATVLIPINSIHHDPRFWRDPDIYDPTRFLPENARKHHRSAYLPFGGGRRVCIGSSFATIEATLIAAVLSQRFVFDLVPGHPVEPEATLTLRPRHGLRMIARRRSPASAQAEEAAA